VVSCAAAVGGRGGMYSICVRGRYVDWRFGRVLLQGGGGKNEIRNISDFGD
jgi:hypothetical protein